MASMCKHAKIAGQIFSLEGSVSSSMNLCTSVALATASPKSSAALVGLHCVKHVQATIGALGSMHII